MGEISNTNEVAERKTTTSENFKIIKPEGDISVKTAKDIIESLYGESFNWNGPHDESILKIESGLDLKKRVLEENAKMLEGTKLRQIPTISERMEGKSVAGVEYVRRVVTLDNGEKVEGVFPKFESKFQVNLPEGIYKASDNEQMKYCTKKLAERIESDPEFAKKFTPRQLEQIRNGEPRISGLTWHHNEMRGIMQLVDADKHDAARHTGGRSIWGGGSESR